MTLFSRFLQRYHRKLNTTAKLDVSEMRRTPFSLDWNLAIRMFDLRMWYIVNSKNIERRFNMVHQVEQLHNDLNYLWLRSRQL